MPLGKQKWARKRISHPREDHIHPKGFGKYLERCPGIGNLYFAGQQAGYPGGVGNALGLGKHAGELV